MLRKYLICRLEATELKGLAISDSDAILERLANALDRLEAVITAKEAENARLRRIEAAASGALLDLDRMLGKGAPPKRNA